MTRRAHIAVQAMFAFMFVAPMALAEEVPASSAGVQTEARLTKKVVDPRIDGEAIVCKREDTTGSRLGAKKVCHTRAEWAAEAVYSRQSAEHLQDSASYH